MPVEKLPPTAAADRDLVGDQGGGVVDQALALEHVDHPPRRADAAHDRGGRDAGRWARRSRRARRTSPTAARSARGPTTATAAVVDQDEPDRVQRDDPRVGAQGAQVGEEGRRVQQRRQEDEQDERPGRAAMSGIPGTSPSTRPPSTSGIGYGIWSQLASAFSPAAETNSAAMTICRSPTGGILAAHRWLRLPARAARAPRSRRARSGLGELLGEELERLARLRGLRPAGDLDAALGQERARLGGDLERLRRRALRRELEDPRRRRDTATARRRACARSPRACP